MAFQPYDPAKAALQQRRRGLALSLGLLAVLLAGQALALRRWLASDTRPASWDQSVHLEIAQDYKEAIAQGRWHAVWHPVPKPGMPAFPPLYHLALQPAMSQAQPEHAALWINFAYFALLTLCVFGLVFEFRSDIAAALAAASFVLAPAVQGLLTTQLVDLAVLAISAAAFWAFIRSEEFQLWAPSLAWAVLFAVGMLHKWSFFSYMIPVFFVAAQALGRSRSRKPALAALALAAALSAPWYVSNWPLLLPRLFQASADFAVPVWHGSAFFYYFTWSLEALGPALFLFGWLGVFVAQYKRKDHAGYLIVLWIACSYVFWSIVPNRQMRFLLPGLPGLAVTACGIAPLSAVGAVLALQVAGAANYALGWLGPWSLGTPLGGVTLLPNDPPAREDWPIDAILKQAETLAGPDEPVANVTVIANAPYFNGPTFTWHGRGLGLQRVHLRGVNRRLCEFSQFVLLKRGELGPASVIGGLKEAAAVVENKRSWFSRGYAEAARWPLPDRSEAVLYQRAKPAAPPMPKKPAHYHIYEQKGFAAENLRVDLGPWDAAAGAYPRARVSAASLKLRDLEAKGVSAELEGLFLVPAAESFDPYDDVRFLKLKRLSIASASVDAASLRVFLEKRVPGLRVASVGLDRTVKISAQYHGLPATAELSVEVRREPRALALRVVSLRLGPNPLPLAAINRIKELTVSLEPNPETPFAIDLPSVTIANGKLTIP